MEHFTNLGIFSFSFLVLIVFFNRANVSYVNYNICNHEIVMWSQIMKRPPALLHSSVPRENKRYPSGYEWLSFDRHRWRAIKSQLVWKFKNWNSFLLFILFEYSAPKTEIMLKCDLSINNCVRIWIILTLLRLRFTVC